MSQSNSDKPSSSTSPRNIAAESTATNPTSNRNPATNTEAPTTNITQAQADIDALFARLTAKVHEVGPKVAGIHCRIQDQKTTNARRQELIDVAERFHQASVQFVKGIAEFEHSRGLTTPMFKAKAEALVAHIEQELDAVQEMLRD